MASIKGPVFFGTDGKPLHLVSDELLPNGCYKGRCGLPLPTWFAPKAKHMVNLSKARFQCGRCEEIRFNDLMDSATEQEYDQGELPF